MTSTDLSEVIWTSVGNSPWDAEVLNQGNVQGGSERGRIKKSIGTQDKRGL